MPELNELKCVICEEIKTKDEIEKFEGMCEDCSQAMLGAEREIDAAQSGEDREGVGIELRMTVERYKKRKAYMAEYNSKPEVAEKRKAYMKGRYERDKALLKKAREAGLI